MLRVLFLLGLLFGGIACTSENQSADQEAIKSIMDNQVSCWNQGNLDCFMEGYLPSDSLMFIGKEGIVYGYQNTLDRYHKSYPDKDAMGTLSFNVIHLNRLSPAYYSMIGQWMLDRKEDDLQGYFTLLFKKINGQWFIIKDHSS
ncbi:YybH family protein [Catalinimonas niigatensis]|uniref:YybH family protein n=1 Tax=Catalinimonas niigatensis TaxID=1397264 RepID=UPI00266551CE|nr:DUF4440 domain-containing protein [Catalinimonas niigatensis]WPP50644.1 DUF4440 domain-containing protein [Catalinimonas niigatensis]